MKEKIIKILEKYESRFNMYMKSENGNISCNPLIFEQVAEEIEKLYNIRNILGSLVVLKENFKGFQKGDVCAVVTEQADLENNYQYELMIVNDFFPKRHQWINKEDIDTFLEFK